jgi:hypothetical protein
MEYLCCLITLNEKLATMTETEKKQEKFPLPLDCWEEYFKAAGNDIDPMEAYLAGFKKARDLRIGEPMYSIKLFIKRLSKLKTNIWF